jgi:hypothetical protein
MRTTFLLLILFILCISKSANSQETIIQSGDTWKYFDTIPEDYWMINNYPDEHWPTAKAPFGYGEGNEATLLNFGSDPSNKIITHYFRKTFEIDDPNKFFVYVIKVLRDDGAVVYINGREVCRSNMPDLPITNGTRALTTVSDEEETIFYEYVLSPNYFTKGSNHISVSVHQSRPTTSDCSFDLELIRHNDLFSVNHLMTGQQSEQILNKSFSLLSIQLELENKNNEINHLQLKNDNLRNYGIFIAFSFFVLLLVLFYLIIRNIKISHEHGNKLQDVKNELQQKNKDIINYALNMVQQKQFLKLIKEELGAVYNRNKNITELDRIVSKIAYHDDHEDEWERLKAHFDTVHSGFFSRLKEKFPALTQSELQHCSYIKLQLPTKEIARMLNIDPKSVQASRYRIKKKMELPLETNLKEVIETF